MSIYGISQLFFFHFLLVFAITCNCSPSAQLLLTFADIAEFWFPQFHFYFVFRSFLDFIPGSIGNGFVQFLPSPKNNNDDIEERKGEGVLGGWEGITYLAHLHNYRLLYMYLASMTY